MSVVVNPQSLLDNVLLDLTSKKIPGCELPPGGNLISLDSDPFTARIEYSNIMSFHTMNSSDEWRAVAATCQKDGSVKLVGLPPAFEKFYVRLNAFKFPKETGLMSARHWCRVLLKPHGKRNSSTKSSRRGKNGSVKHKHSRSKGRYRTRQHLYHHWPKKLADLVYCIIIFRSMAHRGVANHQTTFVKYMQHYET